MSTPLSRVTFNAFEQALSGDLTRIGALASRETVGLAAGMAVADSMYPTAAKAPRGGGELIPGQSSLAGITPSGSSMVLTIGPGQGFTEGTPASTDESPYNAVRWAQSTVTLVADTVNPRVNLIVARPAVAQTNPVSRNILIDPVTRTVAVQTVYKTQDPAATIVMLTGTPAVLGTFGSAPVPPDGSIAAGDLVIAEVFIPANAATASACTLIRRTNRLTCGPIANYHGVIQGPFFWTGNGDEATASSRCFAGSDLRPLRVLIDGEFIETTDPIFDAGDNIGSQDPFAVAAGTSDKPYYLYLCGGRHQSQWAGVGSVAPMVLVRSTVAPDPFGRPSTPIGTPRGATQAGALYVGVGFVIAGTTRGKPVSWDGDWVYARSGAVIALASNLIPSLGPHPICFNQPYTVYTNNMSANLSLTTVPATSTRARGMFMFAAPPQTTSDVVTLQMRLHANNGGLLQTMIARNIIAQTVSVQERQDFELPLPQFSPGMVFDSNADFSTATEMRFLVAATAYNMNVPRFAP